MKHHIFFFLSIFSCTIYSMNISKVTSEDIVAALSTHCYNLHDRFPEIVRKDYVEGIHFHMNNVIQSSQTEEEKKKELMRGLDYLPLMRKVGDRVLLYPPLILGSYEEDDYAAESVY